MTERLSRVFLSALSPASFYQLALVNRKPKKMNQASSFSHQNERFTGGSMETNQTELNGITRDAKSDLQHEEIAKLAYALWEARGGGHGLDEQDWLEAERQLRADKSGRPQGIQSKSQAA
jgi:hypothetical protein